MPTTVTVTDMACDGCEANVEEALEAVPGVESADADHEADAVVVEGDVDTDDLLEAIGEAGYDASA